MTVLQERIWASCFAVHLQELRRPRRHGRINPLEQDTKAAKAWANAVVAELTKPDTAVEESISRLATAIRKLAKELREQHHGH